MKVKNLHFQMMPAPLQKKAMELVPHLCWRLPDLYSLLGRLEVEISKLKQANDFSQRRLIEKLGGAIFHWISSDKDRFEYWCKLCKDKQEASLPIGFKF